MGRWACSLPLLLPACLLALPVAAEAATPVKIQVANGPVPTHVIFLIFSKEVLLDPKETGWYTPPMP